MSFTSPAAGAPPDQALESETRAEEPPASAPESGAAPEPVDEAVAHAAGREADLRLFAGVNAEAFVRASGARREWASGWTAICWPGFLFPPAWFLYRKMYGYAAITVLLPILSSLVHAPADVTRWIGVAFSFLGAFGKRLYLVRARKMAAEIRAAAPDEASARETIMRAGGVSVAGAAIGAVLMAVFVAFAFLKV